MGIHLRGLFGNSVKGLRPLPSPGKSPGADEQERNGIKEYIMSKMHTIYRIGYVFDDGDENWIAVTGTKASVEAVVQEVWEEYGEKPIVKKERVKV